MQRVWFIRAICGHYLVPWNFLSQIPPKMPSNVFSWSKYFMICLSFVSLYNSCLSQIRNKNLKILKIYLVIFMKFFYRQLSSSELKCAIFTLILKWSVKNTTSAMFLSTMCLCCFLYVIYKYGY